jgi:hypothetical protein
MANSVENSCVVLMCVSEKYRQSINRQSEAQYAYKMGRPIIPCIMQNSFNQLLIERLKRFEQEFISGDVKRASRQIFENHGRVNCEVITIYEENKTVLSLFTVLKGLYKLAINDLMRKEIYFLKYPLNILNTKDYLKTFLFKGNAYEIKYTLRYEFNFSFVQVETSYY